MDNLQLIENGLDRCTFEGAVSLERHDGAVYPWRVPIERRRLYPFLTEGDSPVAAAASGVRLTFQTDAAHIGLDLVGVRPGQKLDVFVDKSFSETITLSADQTEPGDYLTVITLPGSGTRLVEIWLDPRMPFGLRALLANPGARVSPAADTRPRWVHYGSSISHAGAAATPSRIWPGLAARQLGWHLTNLGFSGQCVLEPMIGRLIRDLPADLVTLKLGINTHVGRLSNRTFGPCAIGLVQLIREKHPDIPLVVISPIYSPPREAKRMTDLSLTLEEMRVILADVVDACRQYGDRNIHYIDGLDLFGPDERTFLPDQLHPNDDGQPVMAAHFIRSLTSLIGEAIR